MEERRAGRMCDRLSHAGLDADPVDLAHREDLRVELAQKGPLSVVERADTDERELAGLDRQQRPAIAPEGIAGEAERRRQHHSVHVAGRRRRRSVEVAVCVDPDDAARSSHLRHPDESSQRAAFEAQQDGDCILYAMMARRRRCESRDARHLAAYEPE